MHGCALPVSGGLRLRTLLALSTLILLAPLAAADETRPDCEDDQAWIGYARSEPVRALYAAQGSPGGLATCEGEHWDGQDPVSSAGGACSGAVDPDPNAPHANLCLGPDPNAWPGDDPLVPLGARGSADEGAGYAAVNVFLVARVAVYADDGTLALYVRDNTPGNFLWTFVTPPSLTGWPPGETDCDQSTYELQAEGGTRSCGRDNTAVTVEHGLLA